MYFGVEGVVEVWVMFVLDWGMYDVLVLNGDYPSPILSDTFSRMCPFCAESGFYQGESFLVP